MTDMEENWMWKEEWSKRELLRSDRKKKQRVKNRKEKTGDIHNGSQQITQRMS